MPPKVKPTPAELLRLITEHAPALRAAGIQHLSIDGAFSVALAAPDAPSGAVLADEPPAEEYSDPLLDPLTYGNRSHVPGIQRDRDDEDSEPS